jgi:formylglycine-generating enzyme required for sulfatase activity
VAAYQRFLGLNPKEVAPPSEDGLNRKANSALNLPIVNVTWQQADHYCAWANMRLPTEAQWEYAARAGSSTSRYGDLDSIAWYGNNSGRNRIDTAMLLSPKTAAIFLENGNRPHPVMSKGHPNGWGLYDTLGNVWEWVADWYEEEYPTLPTRSDPQGPSKGEKDEKRIRGGSWSNISQVLRVSNRGSAERLKGFDYIGFRCSGELP